MSLIKCKECGAEISSKAEMCPNCGVKLLVRFHFWFVGYFLIFYFFVWFLTEYPVGSNPLDVFARYIPFTLGDDYQKVDYQSSFISDVYQEVTKDVVAQYKIAKNQGDKMQICVQAGFVAAAYLQAKDAVNYEKWQIIKREDCSRAGLDF